MTKNTIGIPFHLALAAVLTESGIAKCVPCFKTLSHLAAMTKLADGHRAVFDAFTNAAKSLGFTGDTQIVRQTSVSLMSKDYSLITRKFGIPSDILGAYVPTKQVPYDQAIIVALKALADTDGDKKAYEVLAQLVGETKLDEECRTPIFNALYESAKKLGMTQHSVVITAAAAIMSNEPSTVAQRFGADIVRIKEIITALKSKPASTDTKHASSSQKPSQQKPSKHQPTSVLPKTAPAQQSQSHARMTGGDRS